MTRLSMPLRAVAFALALALSGATAARAAEARITMPHIAPVGTDAYFRDLLRLALDKSVAQYGAYRLVEAQASMSSERAIEELRQRRMIDVAWMGNNARRQKLLLPVRFSLLKDLNSYRILLIRKDDQARFDAVASLADLRRFTAGTGAQWAITDIVQGSGLPVATGFKNGVLAGMLAARRFDYCPWGLYEAWSEIERQPELPVKLEEHLLLYHEAPIYFFVNPNDGALAARIESGLRIAQADGSFDKLLRRHFKRAIDELQSGKRKVIALVPDGPVPSSRTARN